MIGETSAAKTACRLVYVAACLAVASCTTTTGHGPEFSQREVCGATPVIMIVTGVTLDRERMKDYSEALASSGLYEASAGYYLNAPRAIASFEGTLPPEHATLVVRFPSRDAADTFWNSPLYQDQIKPLREDPSAGDYTVTLYEETPIPGFMDGRVVAPVFSDGEIGCSGDLGQQ